MHRSGSRGVAVWYVMSEHAPYFAVCLMTVGLVLRELLYSLLYGSIVGWRLFSCIVLT